MADVYIDLTNVYIKKYQNVAKHFLKTENNTILTLSSIKKLDNSTVTNLL
jgi:hypothetical protein